MENIVNVYHIPFIDRDAAGEIKCHDLPAADISCWNWSKDYTPKAKAKAYVLGKDGKGEILHIRICCHEKDPKAVYHDFFDDVYKDSCLEAFIGFEKGGRYMNTEMNSNGAALIAVGPDRYDRTRIDELITPPQVKATVMEDRWRVDVEYTIDQLKKIFGDIASLDAGTHFYGNFYKCGDECEIPHYGSWNPIGTPEADFHRPEYFGELVIG